MNDPEMLWLQETLTPEAASRSQRGWRQIASCNGGIVLRLSGEGREGRYRRGHKMKEGARYVKIAEWSDEDRCFIGSCPGLLYGGCHRDDERTVFEQSCLTVDEAIELYPQDGKPLPPLTRGRD